METILTQTILIFVLIAWRAFHIGRSAWRHGKIVTTKNPLIRGTVEIAIYISMYVWVSNTNPSFVWGWMIPVLVLMGIGFLMLLSKHNEPMTSKVNAITVVFVQTIVTLLELFAGFYWPLTQIFGG